jgi:hypothetical protein
MSDKPIPRRLFLKNAGSAGTAAATGLATSPPSAAQTVTTRPAARSAELILSNAKVITVDRDFTIALPIAEKHGVPKNNQHLSVVACKRLESRIKVIGATHFKGSEFEFRCSRLQFYALPLRKTKCGADIHQHAESDKPWDQITRPM